MCPCLSLFHSPFRSRFPLLTSQVLGAVDYAKYTSGQCFTKGANPEGEENGVLGGASALKPPAPFKNPQNEQTKSASGPPREVYLYVYIYIYMCVCASLFRHSTVRRRSASRDTIQRHRARW